jgi:hypothetical protein
VALIRANSLQEIADAYLKIGEAAEEARKKEETLQAAKKASENS